MELVVLQSDPVGHVLRTFYGTHVMNFATWEKAYCMFPLLTLVKGEMLLFRVDTQVELEAYDKYRHRGFTRVGLSQVKGSSEVKGVRSVGDVFTKEVVFPPLEMDVGGGSPTVERLKYRFVVKEDGLVLSRSKKGNAKLVLNGIDEDEFSDVEAVMDAMVV